MNSAVIYARYSSDRQTEQSIEGQTEEIVATVSPQSFDHTPLSLGSQFFGAQTYPHASASLSTLD